MYVKLFLVCAIFGWQFSSAVQAGKIEKSQSRIVGGTAATKPYPYQVSVDDPALYFIDQVVSWKHVCGGSIITDRHILTAAHCVVDRDTGKERQTDKISILAGTHQLNSGGTRYSVCKTKYHPKYLSAPNNYDIAIITIKGVITYVPQKIERITYSKEYFGANVSCILTGWGSTGKLTEGPYPSNLQEVHTTTISYEQCHAEFGFVDGNNLCTLADDGEGGCDGDSGGPLVDINKNVQIGVITSVNSGGCGIGEPDFFSRISAFYKWIQKNTKANNAECGADNSINSNDSGYSSASNSGNNPSDNIPTYSDNKPSNSGNNEQMSNFYTWFQQKKP